jgi:hypothetical protein
MSEHRASTPLATPNITLTLPVTRRFEGNRRAMGLTKNVFTKNARREFAVLGEFAAD